VLWCQKTYKIDCGVKPLNAHTEFLHLKLRFTDSLIAYTSFQLLKPGWFRRFLSWILIAERSASLGSL